MKNLYLFLMLILTCISCQDKKEIQSKQRDKIKLTCIEKTLEKYQIKYIIDDLNEQEFKYTVDFKPIISSKYQLIKNFELTDIYEKDSINYISLNTGIIPTFYFDLKVSPEQLLLLKKQKEFNPSCILVVEISKISKIKISIESDVEGEKDDSYAITYFDSSSDFIGKGRIIDVVSY